MKPALRQRWPPPGYAPVGAGLKPALLFFPFQEIVEDSSEPGVVGYLKPLPKEESILGNDGPGKGP